MIYLLDVNVLLAMHDANHAFSNAAHRWFDTVGREGWATCALTENGFVRITSAASYPGSLKDPAAMVAILRRSCATSSHHFWSESVSLRDLLRPGAIITHRQITDVYLLGLAAHYGGKLATFDRRIPATAVYGGSEALAVIPV
jgi:toxin-antitoxin system PIN domain toxin